MNGVLPPVVRRKLRGYWFGYWSIAVAETLCLAAILLSLGNPATALLALLWVGWKLVRRPDHRGIARAVESRHPELRETLLAAVELAESADPPPVRGSPELLHQLLAEVDQRIAAIDFSRTLSLKPIAALGAAAILFNVALATHRAQVQSHPVIRSSAAPAPPPRAAQPPPPIESSADRLARLEQLAADLRSAPSVARGMLQPYARSLDPAVASARQAASAPSAAERAETRSLWESVSDQLSEFARLAGQVPALHSLAVRADALAREFAGLAAAQRAIVGPGAVSRPGSSASPVPAAAIRVPVGVLPGTIPSGPPWAEPVRKVADLGAIGPDRSPPGYDQAIRDYLNRIAAMNPGGSP